MNKYAGHMMGMMGLMDDDAKMLCKVLEISAAQALALKKKIAMGHKLPSWAEYKVYKAGDALKSAMASTFSMRDHMPKISISIKSGPSMGEALLGKQKMAWVKVASKEKQAKGFAKMQRIQKAVNNKSARLLEKRDAGIPTDKKDWAQRAKLWEIINRLNTKTFHSRKFRGYSKNFPGKHVYKKKMAWAKVASKEKRAFGGAAVRIAAKHFNKFRRAPVVNMAAGATAADAARNVGSSPAYKDLKGRVTGAVEGAVKGFKAPPSNQNRPPLVPIPRQSKVNTLPPLVPIPSKSSSKGLPPLVPIPTKKS